MMDTCDICPFTKNTRIHFVPVMVFTYLVQIQITLGRLRQSKAFIEIQTGDVDGVLYSKEVPREDA